MIPDVGYNRVSSVSWNKSMLSFRASPRSNLFTKATALEREFESEKGMFILRLLHINEERDFAMRPQSRQGLMDEFGCSRNQEEGVIWESYRGAQTDQRLVRWSTIFLVRWLARL